ALSTLSLHDALPIFGSNATMTVGGGATLDTRPGETRLTGDGGFEPTLKISGAGTLWRAGKIMDGFYGGFASHLIVEAGGSITEADRKSTRLNSSHRT